MNETSGELRGLSAKISKHKLHYFSFPLAFVQTSTDYFVLYV